MRVSLGPLTLASPVLAAAGTFGYGLEFARAIDPRWVGAVIVKTLTRHPREGNAPPRLAETPSGMINAVGLQNVGLDAFLAEKLPELAQLPVPVLVSILGESPSEVAEMAGRLDQEQRIAGIELNLSCPNVKHGRPGAAPSLHPNMVAQDADATAEMVAAARRRTTKPLIAKLSPDVTDLAPIAQAAERAGATALSLVNTFIGMSLDPETRRSRLGAATGGVSGPAIRPLAVYRVWYTAQTVKLPIIGLGGIIRAEDAVEFLLAGATAVAVGTATFADPRAPGRVAQGVARYLRRHHIASLDDLRGTAALPGRVQAIHGDA